MLPYLIGGAAGAAAALGAGVYHSLNGRSQLFGPTFIGTPGRGKQLALTYDDGPNDPDTLRLLDVLAKHEVKATFFVIGRYVEQRPDIVQRILAEGHEVGNHTYTHPVLSLCDRENVIGELHACDLQSMLATAKPRRTEDSIEKVSEGDRWNAIDSMLTFAKIRAGQSESRLFRPPFGARRPATLRIAREMGYTPVMWSVWCYDWQATTADRVERHAIKSIRGGDVILLHDGGHKRFGTDRSHTVEATDRIIRRYKDRGFEFVTVSGMMKST
jgi:peptidoglycan-N-acetylglucosamine deacetylase